MSESNETNVQDSDLDEEEDDFVLVEKSQVPRVAGAQSERRWSRTVSNFGRDYPAISEGFKVTMEVAGFPFNILLEIPNLGDRIDWLRTCSKEELHDWVWDQVLRAIRLGGAFAVGSKLQIPMSPLVAGICLVIQKMVERVDSPPPVTQHEPADEKTETLEVNGQRVTFTFVDVVNTDSGQPQKPTPEPQKQTRPALFNLRFEAEDIKNAPHHPLEHSWKLWCASPKTKFKSKQQDWGSSIRPIYTFSTIEDFWGIYNNVRPPSKLEPGWDIYCFKRQIEPKWEDPVCANGGKWTLTFSKGKSDLSWLHALLALIGEQFDRGDEICGAVVNVRHRQEKIALWTKNAANEAAQVSIGKQWKAILDSNETIGYIIHEDARQQERSAKSKYVV